MQHKHTDNHYINTTSIYLVSDVVITWNITHNNKHVHEIGAATEV